MGPRGRAVVLAGCGACKRSVLACICAAIPRRKAVAFALPVLPQSDACLYGEHASMASINSG